MKRLLLLLLIGASSALKAQFHSNCDLVRQELLKLDSILIQNPDIQASDINDLSQLTIIEGSDSYQVQVKRTLLIKTICPEKTFDFNDTNLFPEIHTYFTLRFEIISGSAGNDPGFKKNMDIQIPRFNGFSHEDSLEYSTRLLRLIAFTLEDNYPILKTSFEQYQQGEIAKGVNNLNKRIDYRVRFLEYCENQIYLR